MFSTLVSLFPPNLLTWLEVVVALIVIGIIVSIPAYIAGKAVAKEHATFGKAMVATLLGPTFYVIVLIGIGFVLGGFLGTTGFILALIVAFIAWIGVYKAMFKTGWPGALAIAVLAAIVFIIMLLILGVLLGIALH